MRRVFKGLSLCVALAAVGLFLGGCATRQDTQSEIHKLRASLERAKGAGALKRAPGDLARATMHLNQAQAEFDEWDNDTDANVDAARAATRETWARLTAQRPEILLSGIHFAHDSAEISPDEEATLGEAISILEWEDDTTVLIEGHTSSPASTHYNYGLSERRAEAVAQYFMDKGIAPSRITTAPHSEFRPVASNRSRAGQAENRRVEFKVMRTYPLGYADSQAMLDEPEDYDFPVGPELAPIAEDEYIDKIRKKFSRGTYNVSTGWIELPKTYYQVVSERDLLTGTGYGLAHGVANGLRRSAAGVFEIGTFMVPLPEDWATLDPDILDLRHIF